MDLNDFEEIKELMAKCDKVAHNAKEKKEHNEKRIEEYFSQIMAWCIDMIKNSPHLEGLASMDLGITVPLWGEHLELYIENCHSFDDWKGACFSTRGQYGNNRNSIELHEFVVLNWQTVKQSIIDSIVERQSAYAKRCLSEYTKEEDVSSSLDNFTL